MKVSERRGLCGLCNVGCWVVADYDADGKIIGLRPDESSPMGAVCEIGKHAPELLYSENRLRHPLRRKGPKGTYEFEQITWDEAFTEIVRNLERTKAEHGAEATAIYTGVGSFELAHCDIYQPKGVAVSSANSVLFPFGSPNSMGVGALCYVSFGMIAPHLTLGRMYINMFSDIENAELIVVWGTNPATDLPPLDMERILKARENGAEVVVIDPRRTETARLAEGRWFPIRPGTDGALAHGLCQVLIEEELYDEEFVERWTVGFEDYARYVQHFRPEVVEHITGVSAEDVRWLARRMAESRGVSQLMYTGMEYANSGVQNIRATLVLWALAGQLDVPGGLCFSMENNFFPINRSGLVSNPDVGPRLGRDKFPIYVKYRDEAHAIALPDSVLRGDPYRIRSMIILGGSMITSWPNTGVWRETLGNLDFLVTVDRQLTADAAYADIVLPASTHFETTSYMTYGSMFKIREPMIEPVGEARPDMWILGELADRLGYGHLFPQNAEQLLRHVLDGSGYSLEQVRAAGGSVSIDTEIMQYKKWEKGLLRSDGQPGFDTPSGKLEIASSTLEEYGYDALPVYTEAQEGPLAQPELAREYPLIFNSGARSRRSFHSQHIGARGLNKTRPEPCVTLNTADAAARGINEGDRVRIRTQRGSVAMRARVTEDIVPGAIEANHGGGGPLGSVAWQEANINALTDLNNYDPISGFPVYKALLCQVEKLTDTDSVVIEEDELLADGLAERRAPVERANIYLDHNATTPLSPAVRDAMVEALDLFGNPSSIHGLGRDAHRAVEEARRKVAAALRSTAKRIVFTGSGSEANNLAIKGVAFAQNRSKRHIVTTTIEHPSVLNSCRWLERRGFDVTYLPVDERGRLRAEEFEQAIRSETFLATVMFANNETGSVQLVGEMAAIARRRGVLFHVDAVQALGKIPVDTQALDVDLLTVSAHKVHGPKGVGALYVKRGIELASLTSGGSQEHGLRAATENVAGVVGFGKSCEAIPGSLGRMKKVQGLRDDLAAGLKGLVPGCIFNGLSDDSLPGTLSVTLPELRGESVVLEMDKRGIYLSSGSACKSGSPEPSHALLAMGLSEDAAHCTLRFSLGVENDQREIALVLSALKEVIHASRNVVRFISCK